MKHVLIATHGRMASGIKGSMDILLGGSEHVKALDAYTDEKNVETLVEDFLKDIPEKDQVLFLSDLYGGSVNQVLYRYTNRTNLFLVTGVNLALVLELAMNTDELTAEDIDESIKNCRNAMKRMVYDVPDKVEEELNEDFFA